MLETYLIKHCAPTLASLKTAGLFHLSFCEKRDIEEQLSQWNNRLESKGIRLRLIKRGEQSVLIYVYRKSQLQADLQAPGVASFLKEYGYEKTDIKHALSRLEQRLEKEEIFPHEIGVFLGYPLKDVIGFIRNKGRNCIYTGVWKVYDNEGKALQLFAKYKKCKDIYGKLWKQGRSLLQLTVAA